MILSSKEQYVKFCVTHNSIPIFLQSWWMDAVSADGKWDVLLYKENGKIIGFLIYYIVKRFGYKLIVQPPLTQYNGIWIDYGGITNQNKKVHLEKEATDYFICELEKLKFDFYTQNFNLNFKNWLPFYWYKYSQTTRYTYQIKDISNPEKCFDNFSYAKQKQINKCISTLKSVEISKEQFYNLLAEDHLSKNEKVIYSRQFFYNLFENCKQQNQGKIIAVADENNNLHAALFIVWDKHIAYNLISAFNPKLKSSGGSTLVVYEAIKQMSQKVKTFDFEGSMIKGVENSFRQFGTEQVPYFSIYKYHSGLLKLYFNCIKK